MAEAEPFTFTGESGSSIAMGLLHLLDGYLRSDIDDVDLDEVRDMLEQARRGIEAHVDSLEVATSLDQLHRINRIIAVLDRASAGEG